MKPYTPPKTLDGIKRLAKAIKKEQGCIHAVALNRAAAIAGFQSYQDALAKLSTGAP